LTYPSSFLPAHVPQKRDFCYRRRGLSRVLPLFFVFPFFFAISSRGVHLGSQQGAQNPGFSPRNQVVPPHSATRSNVLVVVYVLRHGSRAACSSTIVVFFVGPGPACRRFLGLVLLPVSLPGGTCKERPGPRSAGRSRWKSCQGKDELFSSRVLSASFLLLPRAPFSS